MDHAHHKDQLSRLRRIEGQVKGVQRMVEEGRYCVDVLTQLRAVRAAVRKVEEGILRAHIEHCVAGALADPQASPTERQNKVDELLQVVGRFDPP
jgi:DNA-binding FrmR family transcriptional regulator